MQTEWHGVLEVHRQLFGFGSVQEQNVLLGPAIEGLHKVPVLLLLSTVHTCHNSRIIRSMWQDSELYPKSNVYREERKGAKTLPCGATILHSSVPETHLPILAYCSLAVR